jgi:AraC-like DNA-binding protein
MASDRFTMGPSGKVLLADLGVSLPRLLQRAGLPEGLFATGTVGLTEAEYYAFWRALDAETGDPLLPIRIGRMIAVETFDPPLFAAFCSPNLTVAATRVAGYKKLIGPMRLVVESSINDLTIETRWTEGSGPPPILVLTELAFWLGLGRTATRTQLQARRVRAPLRMEPEPAQAYRDFFGAPIEYAEVPSITFLAADAERPFLTANERMWDYFEPEFRRQLADLDAGAATAELVRAALVRLLPTGTATMRAVAADLALSTRTLQRKLEAETTSFQAVLQGTRAGLARHYLAQELPVAEIAYLLGYDDTNSFYRAFRSWTGSTPRNDADPAADAGAGSPLDAGADSAPDPGVGRVVEHVLGHHPVHPGAEKVHADGGSEGGTVDRQVGIGDRGAGGVSVPG